RRRHVFPRVGVENAVAPPVPAPPRRCVHPFVTCPRAFVSRLKTSLASARRRRQWSRTKRPPTRVAPKQARWRSGGTPVKGRESVWRNQRRVKQAAHGDKEGCGTQNTTTSCHGKRAWLRGEST
ncbi:unnamed protein product, partial [Ectocarpus sp. 13 AM-2016]